MAGEQDRLPLGEGNSTGNEESRQSLRDLSKTLDRARKAIGPLVTGKSMGRSDRIAALSKTIGTLQEMDLPSMVSALNRERSALQRGVEEALRDRREHLVKSAKESGTPIKRLKEYDYVGGFRVDYRKERVTLSLGSEALTTFEEPDGAAVLARVQEERCRLEKVPFDREEFIEAMKDAIQLAKRQGKDREGKVPIRVLYPLFVLARHGRDEGFLKRPGQRSFAEYPTAQFVFDLARFGRDGWRTSRGERLCNQAPNMASIAKRGSVTLPVLESDGSGGTQLGAVWIDRA